MKTRIFTLLMALLCLPVISWGQIEKPTEIEGEGTEGSPYKISNAEELYWFAQEVNSKFGSNGIGTTVKLYAELDDNINLNPGITFTENGAPENSSPTEWTPIGYTDRWTYNFAGIFDGKGYTISGLYIKQPEKEYQGLFGCNAGTIKNVHISNSYIEAQNMAAAIAGYNGAKGIIDNCSTTETVTIASTTAISGRYGGICARNSGSSDIPANIATIQNCQNAALIKVDIIASADDGIAPTLGGICGESQNDLIQNCVNIGEIRANVANGGVIIGGIVGNGAGSDGIQDCYNQGPISFIGGNSAMNYRIGGICGDAGNIQNCYNTANISVSLTADDAWGMLGGIAGGLSDVIEACYNTGELTISGESSSYSDLGGVCGRLNWSPAHLKYSYNAGKIKADSPVIVGGVIGTAQSNSALTGCFNVGQIESTTNYLGAVCGWESGSNTFANNGYLSGYNLPGFGDGDKTKDEIAEFTPQEIVTAIQTYFTSENKWPENVEVSYDATTGKLTVPRLGIGGENEIEVIIDVPFIITTPEDIKHGTIIADKEYATAGETVTLTITPDEGYELESLTINGEIIETTDNIYTFTMPVGNVTITATFTKLEEPSTPPLPDYPAYYNIYVETCDGAEATLSSQVVKEGTSVTLTIETAEGYDAENMVVKFKRSLFGYWETATPDADGTYQIRNIYTDIYIMVEGVAEETPTGIEQIEGAQVYTRDGSIYVQTPQPEQVLVISASGAILKNERFAGLRRFDNLQRGVYIICIGNERFKVRI